MWWIIDEFLWQTKPGLAYWLATAPLSQRWKVWDGVRLPMPEKGGETKNGKGEKGKD